MTDTTNGSPPTTTTPPATPALTPEERLEERRYNHQRSLLITGTACLIAAALVGTVIYQAVTGQEIEATLAYLLVGVLLSLGVIVLPTSLPGLGKSGNGNGNGNGGGK